MEIELSIGFISYLSSTILFTLLLVIFLLSHRNKAQGWPFLLLVLATIIWGSVLTLSQVGSSLAFEMVMVAEFLRYFTWLYVLQTADGKYLDRPYRLSISDPVSPLNIALLFVVAMLWLVVDERVPGMLDGKRQLMAEFSWMLGFSIIGLIVTEQLFRNTAKVEKKSISLLCLCAGAVFVYDFFVFSNAALTSQIDYEFWSARGVVNSLMIPLLLLAAVRNPTLAPEIHVSRAFVFHSTALIGAGGYLVLMSVAGFYIKESSGEWGKVLQAAFLFAALILLAVVFFSASIKARLRRFLSYSFRNKYDYREEWNRFSRTLLTHDTQLSLYARALKAIAQIVDCNGASLWLKDHQSYICREKWRDALQHAGDESEQSSLIQMMRRNQSLVTRNELIEFCAQTGDGSHWFAESPEAWVVIPLWLNDELFGFVVLRRPVIDVRLDIEDIDLLNTVAHHVALSLFLKKADSELQEAQRFKDINQMTAFLVHDLKTVLSQLSLLVENATQHKNNPQFVDDMIQTVDHATKKMQRLIQQLKQPAKREARQLVDVAALLKSIVEIYRHQKIRPELQVQNGFAPTVRAEQEELKSAIKHIVQNALESLNGNGSVSIGLEARPNNELSIRIVDDGQGMTAEFVADRLFKPFDSTKGVSGMGVGVYQSREYVRSLSGDLRVESEPGKGSTFTINLPMEI
jgi:putative PEP-CTERM system histidine kinase